MRTARQQEARSIRAQGAKQAQIIRAEADAEAARLYAASFGKDPQFYDFYRAMQSYQQTFIGDGQEKAVADEHHSVAAERLFEGILWTLALTAVWTSNHQKSFSRHRQRPCVPPELMEYR